MDASLAHLWAKTGEPSESRWHPLVLHLIDVACAADALLVREPAATRRRMAQILDLPWEDARPWILLLTACHDLGKACPAFQAQWAGRPPILGLPFPAPRGWVNHGFVSQLALRELLEETEWPPELAEMAADAVGCHHGVRLPPTEWERVQSEILIGRGQRSEQIRQEWQKARSSLFAALMEVFGPSAVPTKARLTGPDFMLLAGLTSFADWIGSSEDWFPFGRPADCESLCGWFEQRRAVAEGALDALGWAARGPLVTGPKSFEAVFGFPPRPLQRAMTDVLASLPGPAVILVEAPMGEGKTEAALHAYLELQRRFDHRGLYVALPTKATGNAMFARVLDFLRSCGGDRTLDLQLLHGANLLNERFRSIRLTGIADSKPGGEVRAAEWFTRKKRALLSEYGVGTVDQALLPILPVKHNFVRLWGLANRVVVFDEIHAYDDYTGTLLVDLLRWLVALGSSVVLLSATLSPSIRRRLAGAVEARLPREEPPYPRVSVFRTGVGVEQRHFEADARRRLRARLEAIPSELPAVQSALEGRLPGAGYALALVNTVQRAQDLYRRYPDGVPMVLNGWPIGKRLEDGTEVLLFHGRFPADRRQVREEHAIATFGKEGVRTGRKILIATQVAEQSLDLDFDVIVTDLAPIDLVLQRAGRLWRHDHPGGRPVGEPTLIVAGLGHPDPPSFGDPLWWGKVYREDLLLRTWCLLSAEESVTLPDQIDGWVSSVYEEEVAIPASLAERMHKAVEAGEGSARAQQIHAKMAIIGLPDDASWNDPQRYVLYDEDEPGLHRTLLAQTRLGEESVVVIPLWPADELDVGTTPDDLTARRWYLRAISVSRESVVKTAKKRGVPEGWQRSALLRTCYPLELDGQGRWTANRRVRLDDELGLVYEGRDGE